MKRSNVLATIGDGIDPRPDELREQSKAIAEAGRAPNAEEVCMLQHYSIVYANVKADGRDDLV